MKVNVLGTDYEIIIGDENEYPHLKEADGYCDFTTKKITVSKLEVAENTYQDMEEYTNKVIRHELVHAFLYESGLSINSEWAGEEELVDWIAIQIPKMASLFTLMDID